MAYNYINIVNEVNRRLNEVELTTTTFPTATGFYATVKDAVNASIRDINHIAYEWPFNHVTKQDVLVVGTTRYVFPADCNTIDFDTFRIKENETLNNVTSKLEVISYDDYLTNSVDQEYRTDKRELPRMVFQAPSLEFGVSPAPDQAYEIVYEYYSVPIDLNAATDVPTIPERFKHVIVDGAMYHAYMFRSNEQAATLAKSKMEEGVKRMRTMLVNRYAEMRSTIITTTNTSSFGSRVA